MLHKASYLRGLHIAASDGEIGHVDDFIVDEHLKLCYLVVDTSNWIGGRSVLLSPGSLEVIDIAGKYLRLNLTRDEIRRSPSIDVADIELLETLPPIVFI